MQCLTRTKKLLPVNIDIIELREEFSKFNHAGT